MISSRVDCHFWSLKPPADKGTTAFVVLNPMLRPGSVVAAGTAAQRENIGSQVACKLAIDHFVEDVLDRFSAGPPHATPPEGTASGRDPNVEVLESAFKRANSSVYAFGHKLAAGGRMSASLIGLVISENTVATARAGDGSAFLLRRGELFPFFESKPPLSNAQQASEQLIGAHSLISVEVASVSLEPEDLVLLLGSSPDSNQERRLPVVVRGLDKADPNPIETVVRRVFDQGTPPPFALLVRIGPKAIYLDQPI